MVYFITKTEKSKLSFALKKYLVNICGMIIAVEVLAQIADDISAVRGFL